MLVIIWFYYVSLGFENMRVNKEVVLGVFKIVLGRRNLMGNWVYIKVIV